MVWTRFTCDVDLGLAGKTTWFPQNPDISQSFEYTHDYALGKYQTYLVVWILLLDPVVFQNPWFCTRKITINSGDCRHVRSIVSYKVNFFSTVNHFAFLIPDLMSTSPWQELVCKVNIWPTSLLLPLPGTGLLGQHVATFPPSFPCQELVC